jgi:hypothetical protein
VAYTTIPDVRAALYDTILPAAIASLPATITTSGSTFPLRVPVLYYGLPGTNNPPDCWVGVVGSTSENIPIAVLPQGAPRFQDEEYDMVIRVWYHIGDTDPNAQRAATESAYAVYRAIVAQLRANTGWTNALTAPYQAFISSLKDQEFALAEGRALGLEITLHIKTRV